MKHLILRKLMLIAVLLTSSHAFAHDFEVNGIYYNITSETDLTVEVTYKDTNYNSYSGDIVIPENVTNGGTIYTVASIGNYAFSECADLTELLYQVL